MNFLLNLFMTTLSRIKFKNSLNSGVLVDNSEIVYSISGKTNQPDPLSPKQADHWKPGSIDPLLFDKNSKELFLSQRA